MSKIDPQLHADADEIAAAIGKDKSSVTRRANKEKWLAVFDDNSRGKHKKKWFEIAKLPKEIKQAVWHQRNCKRFLAHETGEVERQNTASNLFSTGGGCGDSVAISSVPNVGDRVLPSQGVRRADYADDSTSGNHAASAVSTESVDVGKSEDQSKRLSEVKSRSSQKGVERIGDIDSRSLTSIDHSKTTEKQRKTDGARQYILNFIDHFDGKKIDAVKFLNQGYIDRTLHLDLLDAYVHCNDKRGKSGKAKPINMRNLQRWREMREETGYCLPALTRTETDWHDIWFLPMFLACYRKPQKPSVAAAYAEFVTDLTAQGYTAEQVPAIDSIYRAIDKVPEVVLQTGRSSGSELKAFQCFIRRDWSGPSNQTWVGDGHTFKAKVRHPDTGRAFAPEVTMIIDAASRFIVGWSFSLSENQIAVSEALGRAMTQYGKPLIYYSDNGSGQTAKTIDCPAGGMLARLGVHHMTGIPGNPQGRGLIEGMWDITTIAVAKTLPTFQGTGMDEGTMKKNTQAIDKAKRQGLTPTFVTPWAEFMLLCEERFAWYNTQHKHRALGGKTPAEVYFANLDALGCKLTDHEIATLYRPSVVRMPSRGEVRWLNNIYFHQALNGLPEGTQVRVHYDMHDARQVWVTDLDGVAICVAEFEGNKRAGMPVSLTEHLKDQRLKGIVKNAEDKIENAHAERDGLLDADYSRLESIPANQIAGLETIAKKIESRQENPVEMAPTIPQDDRERYWFYCSWKEKAATGEGIPEGLQPFMQSYPNTAKYRAMDKFYNPSSLNVPDNATLPPSVAVATHRKQNDTRN